MRSQEAARSGSEDCLGQPRKWMCERANVLALGTSAPIVLEAVYMECMAYVKQTWCVEG